MYHCGGGVGHRAARQASAPFRASEWSRKYRLHSAVVVDDDDDMYADPPLDGEAGEWQDAEDIFTIEYGDHEVFQEADINADEVDDYGYAPVQEWDAEGEADDDENDDENALGPEDGEDPALEEYDDYGYAEL